MSKLAEFKNRKLADLARVSQKQRHKRDDAAYFKLVGGPFHGLKLRLYAPWDEITFNGGQIRYEIHPPVDSSADWVYIHVNHPDSQEKLIV